VVDPAAPVADDHLGLGHPLALAPFPGRDRVGLAPESALGGPGLGLEPLELPVGRRVLPGNRSAKPSLARVVAWPPDSI
jgi:hypothetical protein